MLALEIKQEIRDLGLRGEIEGAESFVENEDFGAGNERTCDRDALTLAAAEFVGPAGQPFVAKGGLFARGNQAQEAIFLAEVGLVDFDWLERVLPRSSCRDSARMLNPEKSDECRGGLLLVLSILVRGDFGRYRGFRRNLAFRVGRGSGRGSICRIRKARRAPAFFRDGDRARRLLER